MPILTVENLSVKKGGIALVNNINLKIHSGEIHAIVGPNGAGKTTLLNAITGDVELSKGSIAIGEQAKHFSVKDRARALAILPQFSLLNFPYTVNEVVALGRIPHSTGYALDQEIVREAMAAMDISYLSERLYTQLSGGEKQRCQLARVMAQIWRKEDAEKRLLLLDEPTTGLDLGHQQQLMDAVKRFSENGVGILMVVHDINLAAKYADYSLALACGECLAQGPTHEVLEEALLQKLFGVELRLVQDPKSHKNYVLT